MGSENFNHNLGIWNELMNGQKPDYPPICLAAFKYFIEHNVNVSLILQLQDTMSVFKDQYKHCPEKVESITHVFLTEDGKIKIPNFFDHKNPKKAKQCADLSTCLYSMLVKTGLASAIIAALTSNDHTQKIELFLTLGKGPTHFLHKKTNHTFITLDRFNIMGEPSNNTAPVIDPSFYFVTTAHTGSKYQPDPKGQSKIDPIVSVFEGAEIEIYDLKKAIDSGTVKSLGNKPNSVILGISEDSSYVYGLGCGVYKGKLIWFIDIWHSNGEDRSIYYYNNSRLCCTSTNHQAMALSNINREEIQKMLESAKKIRIIRLLQL